MATKKKTKTKGVCIQLDGSNYDVKFVSKAEVMKLINEFKIGKFKVFQDGKSVRPSQLKKGVSAKIVRQDKAG